VAAAGGVDVSERGAKDEPGYQIIYPPLPIAAVPLEPNALPLAEAVQVIFPLVSRVHWPHPATPLQIIGHGTERFTDGVYPAGITPDAVATAEVVALAETPVVNELIWAASDDLEGASLRCRPWS
jgi:hypothetical protein